MATNLRIKIKDYPKKSQFLQKFDLKMGKNQSKKR